MPKSLKTSLYRHYVLAVSIALAIFVFHQFHFVDFNELEALDLRFLVRGPKPAYQDIVVVEMDETSVENLGAWPWPRKIHTEFLNEIGKYKPRLVIYNVLLTQESSAREEDKELATAIEKAGNVILPFYYYSEEPFQAFFPIPLLQESARATGFLNLPIDRDGKIRRSKLFVKSEEAAYYPVSVLAASNQGMDEENFRHWLEQIPIDPLSSFWIHYPGPASSFQRVSFSRVVKAAEHGEESFMQRLFENRIVLVGKTTAGDSDLQKIPFSSGEPEIFIQASALHTLLSKQYLRSTNRYLNLLMLLSLALAACWSAKMASPNLGIFSILGLTGGYAAFNFSAFYFTGWIFPFFVPLITMGLIYILVLFVEAIEIRFRGELMDQELGTAARIQETFLPRTMPVVENLDIDVEYRFARQVGGDLYDWTDFGDGNFGICVGDVSGKGVPAAIYMARAISDFRRENKSDLEPGELCRLLNAILTRDMAHNTGMFLTLIYVVTNTKKRKLWVTNAAHMPMIFYRHRLRKASILLSDTVPVGKPLGLFTDAAYKTAEMPFEPGDYFFLISDGIKEARNEKGREFGLERIRKLIEDCAGIPCEELMDHLFQDLHTFQKGLPLHDDCTAVCVRFRSGF
ncbi:MAG: CHASE2 domain-containing protein [Candidatus Omnitrophica bacterium]|nr:CHASE2 domain-containing protein [Candidatus Omnitrophota bacterium]